ncbi:sacsin N-terminal ATP-binding-like domain-containing protein [Hymenobacter jeollabukensis]|uniref:ATP-binding protein n=1 Tax=Hymenobacter jeollabukensis TaxID=2025313 RepID=A0A5R8WJS8_9BACT|nr:hypothetical protein [Hymenobacter jeollabukensis]TLM88986.1 hypothetical protein FDY95_22660 [Hymenobacter jeollabukensis]
MPYKNMREYRTRYRQNLPLTDERNDEHFVGTVTAERDRFGFFSFVHGNKRKIENLLTGTIDMADDSQGIYEFIQNAADCDATHFYLFFNEQYFLAINNGFAFTNGGVDAILNSAQTSDDKEDTSKIGRYGIGFKLVHRLVGKGNGITELLKEYAGPVIYSWSQPADFSQFVGDQALSAEAVGAAEAASPWLFKILLTCFPAMPGEEVRDLNYQPRVGFPTDELAECRAYLRECAPQLDLDQLSQGSLFFLKLGEGKSQKLRENEQALGNGMRSALHLLGKLQHVSVQGQAVQRLDDLHLETFTLPADDPRLLVVPLENSRDQRSPLECTFGFAPVEQASALLKTEASFFKYFPVAAEDAPYTFVLHSNLLGIEPNRTQLQPNDINKQLLPLAVTLLYERLQTHIGTNPSLARRIWGGILLSDEPPMGQKHAWQKPVFYDPLLAGLPAVVPTASGGFRPVAQVKIKQTKLPVEPAALGIAEQEWFRWESGSELANHAGRKLKLVQWNIKDLISSGNIDAINDWLKSLTSDDLTRFVSELSSIKLEAGKVWTAEFLAKLCALRFVPFADGVLWSISMVVDSASHLLLPAGAAAVSGTLHKAGLHTSFYSPEFASSAIGRAMLQKLPYFEKNSELFTRVSSQISEAFVQLNAAEKLPLFTWFESLGITTTTLRKLVLFRNAHSNPMALGELVSKDVTLPSLFKWAEVHADDYSAQLDKYLLKKPELYASLIQTRWESWKTKLTTSNIAVFSKTVVEWYAAASNPGHLPGPKTVLTTNGWQPTGSVFYHSKLSESANYKALGEAILALYGWQVPESEMLPWLATEPFKLDVDTLACTPKANLLTSAQVAVWIALAKATEVRLTDYLTLRAEAGQYQVMPRTNGRPRSYFSTDEAVRTLAEANCPDLHPLPLDAHGRSLRDEEAVLKDAKLLTALLDELPATEWLSEALQNLMAETSYSSVVRDWLTRLPRVEVELEAEYPANHLHRRLLELAARTLADKPSELAAFRRKLFLSVPHHAEFALDGAAEADEIKLKTGTGADVKLRRSALLPGADQKSEWVNQLADRLAAGDDLRKLLGLGEEHDHGRLQADVLAELANFGNVLQNATQVAYVLLTGEDSEVYSLTDFQVLSADGQPYALTSDWYTKAPNFIDPGYVLGSDLAELPDLLKMSGQREYNIPNTAFRLLSRPYFTGQGLQAPGLREDLDEVGQQTLLTYLYERWEKREQQTSKYDWPTDWTTLAGVHAARALGFVPAEVVLPVELATSDELAPDWLVIWASTNSPAQRQRFLATLGVAVDSSPLANLRRAFQLPPAPGPAANLFEGLPNQTNEARQRVLTLTLRWLDEQQIRIASTWHQQLLTGIFERLDINHFDWERFAYLTADFSGATWHVVRCNSEDDLQLDANARTELHDHGLAIVDLLKIAADRGLNVLDMSIYPENWSTLSAKKIVVEANFNRSALQSEACEVPELAEWASENAWTKGIINRVFTVPGDLPQVRTLLQEPLTTRYHGRLWVDLDEGNMYVKADDLAHLPELLAEQEVSVFTSEGITALRHALRDMDAAYDKQSLLTLNQQLTQQQERERDKDRQLAIKEDRIRELEQRIALMEQARLMKPTDAHPSMDGDDGDGTTDIQGTAAAAAASQEAVAKAKVWLQSQPGYDCSRWEVQYSVVRGVRYDGQPLTLVVKSAKLGYMYLTPFDWLALAREKPSALLVLTANGHFRPTTLEDLEQDERNRRYSLKVSLNEYASEKMLTALAVFYRELYGETGVQTTFKFHQPGANYTDSLDVPLRGFFGSATNPDAGPVSPQSDDVL